MLGKMGREEVRMAVGECLGTPPQEKKKERVNLRSVSRIPVELRRGLGEETLRRLRDTGSPGRTDTLPGRSVTHQLRCAFNCHLPGWETASSHGQKRIY